MACPVTVTRRSGRCTCQTAPGQAKRSQRRRARAAEMIELAVQINGKKRGIVQVAADAGEEAVLAAIRADQSLRDQLGGKAIRKFILVPGRLVNLVI